jgi:hypothetical protein
MPEIVELGRITEDQIFNLERKTPFQVPLELLTNTARQVFLIPGDRVVGMNDLGDFNRFVLHSARRLYNFTHHRYHRKDHEDYRYRSEVSSRAPYGAAELVVHTNRRTLGKGTEWFSDVSEALKAYAYTKHRFSGRFTNMLNLQVRRIILASILNQI